MFLSQKEIDRIVNGGGVAQYEYWVYDIIANRLEATGFERKSSIADNVSLDGSIYCRHDGHIVVVGTHRTQCRTFVRSVPYPKTEESEEKE